LPADASEPRYHEPLRLDGPINLTQFTN